MDRGQRHLAVAVTPEGRSLYLSFGWIRHIRRHYAAKRRRLQKAGKHKTVKRLEQKEQRIIRHTNHILSKKLVAFAKEHGCGIRMEDLTGIRQSPQRKATKSQADHNRDFWPYYDLETKTAYKALSAGIKFEKVPAAYTSQTCCKCGAIGVRNRHSFRCERCGYRGHADHNAGRNLANWLGLSCPWVSRPVRALSQQGIVPVALQAPQGGVHGTPWGYPNGNLPPSSVRPMQRASRVAEG